MMKTSLGVKKLTSIFRKKKKKIVGWHLEMFRQMMEKIKPIGEETVTSEALFDIMQA
jgi:hypothetical protein